MARDRNELLKQFLKNPHLKEILGSEDIDFTNESFSNKSDFLLVEVIKKMIISYSMEDSSNQTLKKINAYIANEVKN
ncbi:hypothetical protein QR676_21400 [Vibrio sp. TMPB1044]|uniref:hypothetical protein n=1 Tax=Vibrio sp. TMPB1044 TaxID=3051822 RepID=UPI00255B64B0|nr:hypothetical protein [Vibrio sp. TMPB1044]MDL5029786.1 hypothetical protein [Vibrio sp. TMPB1044]MDN5209914.1 hypothetical protein [Vibrio sp. TMPB1044]